MRLSQVFAPKEREFFDLFEEAGNNAAAAGRLLVELFHTWPDGNQMAEIRQCETTGDRITHDIIQRLNGTFVTPIEREDILALTSALDDVVDEIEEAADYLGLYRIEAPTHQAIKMTELISEATRLIAEALPRLRDFGNIRHHTVEVNRLENEADRVVRDAIAALFDGGIDPMVVIRFKDVYDRLEAAIDACEHVADILEGIVIKNA